MKRRTSSIRPVRTDWRFVWSGFLAGLVPLSFAFWAVQTLGFPPRTSDYFNDASLYWHATETWLSGGDPWTVSGADGVLFAGWPPTLLLNLPLMPLGPESSLIFWPVAGAIGAVFLVRSLRLPIWWVFAPVILEAWLPGSPDPALAGLALLGGGAVVALTKPYAIPSLLAMRRWRAVGLATLLLVATVPVLPWQRFVLDYPTIILPTYLAQTHDRSFGDLPLLIPFGLLALARLGPVTGMALATPTLWPHPQRHYSMLSLGFIASSPTLAVAFALPIGWSPVAGVILVAAIGSQAVARSSVRDVVLGSATRPPVLAHRPDNADVDRIGIKTQVEPDDVDPA